MSKPQINQISSFGRKQGENIRLRTDPPQFSNKIFVQFNRREIIGILRLITEKNLIKNIW